MVKRKEKYSSGAASTYMSHRQAMRKLQISLPNFRRLCILKGIYPVEPRHKSRAAKGSNQPKIFYYTKDIKFLSKEPLINIFRKLRIYQKKLKHARAKLDKVQEYKIRMRKPRYTLHELVKERYPSREDAIRDLNDSLNLVYLFSRLPKMPHFNSGLIRLSKRLAVEFTNFVVATRSVRKAFISIKGIYVEAEIMGIPVVWIIPHASTATSPTEVDYRILSTCLEFDCTLIGSLLCNMYKQNNLVYPPRLAIQCPKNYEYYYASPIDVKLEYLSSLSYPLKRIEEELKDEECVMQDLNELKEIDDSVSMAVNKQIKVQNLKKLFDGKKFFINREVPRDVMSLLIRSCGGTVSWSPVCGPGSTFTEEDDVDYQIVDRPMQNMKVGRFYVQPQWIFDSINAVRLMSAQDYMPGVELPAHLSPFALEINEKADPTLGIKQRQTPLSGAAPGYGSGAALYRPPEADYLAGLVSLAEIRGAPVAAQKEADDSTDSELEDDEEDPADTEKTAQGEEEKVNSKKRKKIESTKSSKKKKPKYLNESLKKLEKEEVEVKTGEVDTADRKEFKKKALANAERKLQELSIPKKRQRLYKKMKHSVKLQNKEIRDLTERRKSIDNKR